MLFPINFKNIFISIFLNILNIELKEDSDINESKNLNIDIQTYLAFEREYKEFRVIRVNLNTVKNNGEKYPYNEDNFYFEPNNVRYNNIIWMNCIYNYCIFYLRFKTTNNFFFKIIFRFIKKVYKKEKTRY